MNGWRRIVSCCAVGIFSLGLTDCANQANPVNRELPIIDAPAEPDETGGISKTEAGIPKRVLNPRVTTDQSVNAASIDSAAASLIKPGMTNEQKVLAAFNWCRSVIYHGAEAMPVSLRYNVLYQFNVLGVGSCLSQTTPLHLLWTKMGFTTRNWNTMGHHCIQVFYDGQWHLFDPHANFYVYDRSTPRAIASVSQIQADTTLVSLARAEKRACPGFLLCGDPTTLFSHAAGYDDMGNYPEPGYTPIINEPFGDIALRRGETYIRTWMPGPYWSTKYFPNAGPRHSCGTADAADAANYPLYAPHYSKGYYRHWGAGRLEYRPGFASGNYMDAVHQIVNFEGRQSGDRDALLMTNPGSAAEVVFSAASPYMLTGGSFRLIKTGQPSLTVQISINKGTTWLPITLQTSGDTVRGSFSTQLTALGFCTSYLIKIAIAGDVAAEIPLAKARAAVSVDTKGFEEFEWISHFQLNPFSLPHLVPGTNMVRVDAEQFDAPLSLTYRWSEGSGWLTARESSMTFMQKGQFAIQIPAGTDYPRMESVEMSVAP